MTDAPVVVIGGGPAGVSAAVTLGERGHRVLLVEQRAGLGGAIHRQPANREIGHALHRRHHQRVWKRLTARLAAVTNQVTVRHSTVYIGSDDSGLVLLEDRVAGRVFFVRPLALLLAVGAIETVHPFEGWDLPGVTSAGGAQMILKETGSFMQGRTLVAGTGPLPFAVSAQLSSIGQPPVALLERGDPWRFPLVGFRLLCMPRVASEMLAYGLRLLTSRVEYITGSAVEQVTRQVGGLSVRVIDERGARSSFLVDNLIVSDGLRANDVGLPPAREDASGPILRAGDCRGVLGADAAVADGEFAARKVAALLAGDPMPVENSSVIGKARYLQALLRNLTSEHSPEPTEQTIFCRCEGRTKADLAFLGADRSPSETRLLGRFGMGACQGRFCGASVSNAVGIAPERLSSRPETYPRWPIRPVSLAALSQLDEISEATSWK
ncbi:FAD-dependent oxidoreductase [Mesorhizobium sp. M0751]|uniref:FAD-dependent oxidoreductase n=1 Tax=unclassified Mesorhizobium TaxID=325217 RepID=UPI0033380E83